MITLTPAVAHTSSVRNVSQSRAVANPSLKTPSIPSISLEGSKHCLGKTSQVLPHAAADDHAKTHLLSKTLLALANEHLGLLQNMWHEL